MHRPRRVDTDRRASRLFPASSGRRREQRRATSPSRDRRRSLRMYARSSRRIDALQRLRDGQVHLDRILDRKDRLLLERGGAAVPEEADARSGVHHDGALRGRRLRRRLAESECTFRFVAGSTADRTIARQQRIEEQLAAELGARGGDGGRSGTRRWPIIEPVSVRSRGKEQPNRCRQQRSSVSATQG